MTEFQHENLNDYYDIREELGRYQTWRKRSACGWVVGRQIHGAVGIKQMWFESGIPLVLLGGV